MIKKLIQYFRTRRERKLRKKLVLSVGMYSTTQAVQAWVEYILYNKPTKEILLSASESQRVKKWIELLNSQSQQPNHSAGAE